MISIGIFAPSENSPCAGIEGTSCRALLFLPTSSVTLPVTTSAKGYQIVCHIVTEPAPRLHVMDLQAFHGTALLAPPTISLQDAGSK
jgi:hypothetical protein